MVMYNIIGVYEGNKEIIDQADSPEEAEYLVQEYKLAFGEEWKIYYVIAEASYE